jgi:hypothetical protein
VGRSNATDRPVWPLARFFRYSSFDSLAVLWPAYVRITQGLSRSGNRCSLTPLIVWSGPL